MHNAARAKAQALRRFSRQNWVRLLLWGFGRNDDASVTLQGVLRELFSELSYGGASKGNAVVIVRSSAVLCITLGVALSTSAGAQDKFVPDAATAISIAKEASSYGDKKARRQRPWIAYREGNVWVVTRTTPCPRAWHCSESTEELRISRANGQILGISGSRCGGGVLPCR